MQAIITTADQPLALGEVDDPTVGPDDVLIDVRAAGLNRADLMQRAGHYPPPPGAPDTMGLEAAGTVIEVGSNVTEWSEGDRVCALLPGGGYAEKAIAHQGSVFPLPEALSFVEGAALAEAMMTVWANVFMRCRLQAGESFLVHGGTSGIGVMAIQMAKAADAAAIFATAGSDEKTSVCTDLGATRAINYRSEDFVEVVKDAGGVDVILDMVGGDYITRNIDAANLNGRICNIAYQNGFEVTVNFGPVLRKRLVLTATTLRARTDQEKQEIRDAVRDTFWGDVESGAIRPIVDSTYDLADADAAQAAMESGGHIGKIVLTSG